MNSFDFTDFRRVVGEKDLKVLNVRVLQDGQCLGTLDQEPDRKCNIYSATKSIASAAVGFAVQESLLHLDETVADAFPDELPAQPSDKLKRMRLVHLLTMSMGFESQYLMGSSRNKLRETEPDWVRFVLRQNVAYEPGTEFMYNNAGPYLLGVLVQRRSGQSLVDYLTPRLLEPLGIERPTVETCPLGYDFAAGGMYFSAEELARFGQLYLNGGAWNGRQLLDPAWIEASHRSYIRSTNDRNIANEALYSEGDLGSEYGYFFWVVNEHLYAARGKFGQYCLIDTEKHAVVSALSDERKDHRLIMWMLERYILDRL